MYHGEVGTRHEQISLRTSASRPQRVRHAIPSHRRPTRCRSHTRGPWDKTRTLGTRLTWGLAWLGPGFLEAFRFRSERLIVTIDMYPAPDRRRAPWCNGGQTDQADATYQLNTRAAGPHRTLVGAALVLCQATDGMLLQENQLSSLCKKGESAMTTMANKLYGLS